MSTLLTIVKSKLTKTRKLPYLPRIGLTVEVAGRQFVLKHAPLLETLANLKERGFSLANLKALAWEEAREIDFPAVEHAPKAPVKAPTVTKPKAKADKKKKKPPVPVRKTALKAAAQRRGAR